MKTSPIQIIVLEPEDGYVLTNGEVYSTKVYLCANDQPENWWEIPDSEVPDQDMTPEAEQEGGEN